MIGAQAHSVVLAELARAAGDDPTADKLLICRPRGVGRELLHSLAQAGDGWLGFRVQTPFELAAELATPSLAAEGLAPIDRFDEIALLDEAIDVVLETRAGDVLRALGEAVGFRNALAGVVRELRLAGLDSAAVSKARLQDARKKNALAAIQRAYEAALRDRGRVDRAEVLRRAATALDLGDALCERVYLLPGMHLRGTRGDFLAALLRRGAVVLGSDPVLGLERPAGLLAGEERPAAGRLSYLYAVAEAPEPGAAADLFTPAVADIDIELFAAASPVDELREVLRRVMAAGIPWDEVEVVATDPVVYGTGLDSIATQLVSRDGASRVTHAAGLPIARTRTGRAVAAYLRWIQEDFPEDILRPLLHDELVRPAGADGARTGGPVLAATLRELRVGWGRDRYLQQIDWRLDALARADAGTDRRRRTEEQREADTERNRARLEALRGFLSTLLAATPPTPDRLGASGEKVAAGAIAGGVIAFLEFVETPAEPDTEAEAKRRLLEVLRRAAATLRRPAPFRAAAAVLGRLIDLRVPSPSTYGRVPWSSAGGYLHFADLDHGGLSGRRHTFVVGLDASRFPGSGRQDALLLDHDRARLGDALPRSGELLDEKRWGLAALIARLRGRVTFSYSAWDASEGRNLSPSPLLLQLIRLHYAEPDADYRRLHEATRPIRGPVPAGGGLLDDADVWLDELDEGQGLLRRGVEVVRHAYAGLDAGLRAREARGGGRLGPYMGAVTARPELFDPRRRGGEEPLSASRLETLATCPLRYFYSYVLGLRPPDDIEFEPDRWLDPRQRGSMFHDVYERTLAAARRDGVAAGSPALAELANEIFDEEIARSRHLVPVPSEAVFERERRALRADLGVFLAMLPEEEGSWLATEWCFGFEGVEPPAAELRLPSGTAWLRGAVDRIDELPGGALAIVDYKTGGGYGYREEAGVYDGGRRLQHALYTHAVEQLLGRPVEKAAYHLPTRKGEGVRVSFERDLLDRWPEILGQLFDMIAAGWFPPPFDKEAPCKFCDFRPLCRVREDRYGKVESPPVVWAQANNALLREYAALQRIRQIDE